MAVEQDQRPSFFQGQYLGPEDLTATVEYSRIQQARHSLGAHTWGIAIGLELIEKPSPSGNNQVDVFLTPGYAWDGFGRPIVVLAPFKVPVELFQNITGSTSVLVPVWLRYADSANDPAASGFEVCDVANQMGRIQETFTLEAGQFTNITDQRDPVSIGGKLVDATQALIAFNPDPKTSQVYDASIPQQALPEDNAEALWLIPVGAVRWLPGQPATQPGSFTQRSADDLTASESQRQYIGVVAGAVEIPGKHLEVKLRGSAPTVTSDDLLWVEGKMRVEGDVSLFGGKLSFLDSAGKDGNVPLVVQRASQPGPNAGQTLTSLQVEIGKDNAGNNMLQVGPLNSSSKFASVFNVLDNGKVGVGTTTPRNPLGIRAAGQWEELLSFEDPSGNTKWHINQNPNGNNSGLNFAETSVADFRLFIQAGGKVGVGTSAPSNRLHVDDILGIRQKYMYLSGDKGWSSLTFNAYHDAQNQNWTFPDPSTVAVTIEMDDRRSVGGTVGGRFEVWSTTLAAKSSWIQRFGIDGETGNVFMAHQGGNVGIGTANPQALLDVAGQIQLNADGSVKAKRWNVTQVISQAQGPLPISKTFNSGGGTLLILASGSGWSGNPGKIIGMQISVDGINRGNAQSMTNEDTSHKAFVSSALVVSGLPGGAHNLSLQAEANTNTDVNDFFSVTILELPF